MKKTEIQNLIKELLDKATLPAKEIIISGDDDMGDDTVNPKTTWFSVELSQPHYFLGREGEALFALNYLVKKIVEAKLMSENKDTINKGYPILIDINGFHKKRIESIHAIAHMMAERARYFKSNIEVDPMSAFDRRIVHEFLANEHDLKTESEGVGPSRRVVIKYIGSI